jgi:glucose-6-phosphate-specific signal transduction histidine kinase
MRALAPCRWASVAMFDSDARVIAMLATHSNHQDEPKQALTAHTSSGLAGMVERVRLLDGQLTIASTPGHGARLSAELPLGAALTER